MKLKAVEHDLGRLAYCGPTAIAAMAGVSTTKAWEVVNKIRNRKPDHKITAMSTFELTAAMDLLGYAQVKSQSLLSGLLRDRKTLGRWLRERKDPGEVNCVLITGHFITVERGRILDTWTNEVPVWLHEFKKWDRKRVQCVFRFQGGTSEHAIEEGREMTGMSEKGAYLVNLDTMRAVNRFESIEAADAMGCDVTYNYDVVTGPDDLDGERYKLPELVALYNAATGAQLKRFSDRATAVKRTWAALEENVLEIPGVETTTPVERKPVQRGKVSTLDQVRAYFLNGGRGTTKEIAEAIGRKVATTGYAISDLQNVKYAGPERVMQLEREEGVWRRA